MVTGTTSNVEVAFIAPSISSLLTDSTSRFFIDADVFFFIEIQIATLRLVMGQKIWNLLVGFQQDLCEERS